MCEGEKRKLSIPSDLGYGDRGSPPKIPGNFFIQVICYKYCWWRLKPSWKHYWGEPRSGFICGIYNFQYFRFFFSRWCNPYLWSWTYENRKKKRTLECIFSIFPIILFGKSVTFLYRVYFVSFFWYFFTRTKCIWILQLFKGINKMSFHLQFC